MSDEEIRREYRLAKNPAKQIKILADENDVSRETIRRIVAEVPHPSPAATASPQGKPTADLNGFVPFQELAENEKRIATGPAAPRNDGEEKDMDYKLPAGVREPDADLPSETPTWHPLPSAPPQAAADFPEEAAPETGGRIATGPAAPRNDGPSSLPDVQDLPEAGTVTGVMKPRAAERRYFLTEPQLMELWFILGKLRGVLDAAAEAGKPGEVMKDAVDELESLLRSLS